MESNLCIDCLNSGICTNTFTHSSRSLTKRCWFRYVFTLIVILFLNLSLPHSLNAQVAPPSKVGVYAIGADSIRLAWAARLNDSGSVEIEKANHPAGPWTSAGSGPSSVTFFDLGGFVEGVTYYFRLRYQAGSEFSDWSDIVFKTFQIVGDGAPGIVQQISNATATGRNNASLEWDEVSDPSREGLEVQLAKNVGGPWLTSGHADTSSVGIIFDHLENGIAHYFRIRGFNAYGTSEWSDPVSVETVFGIPETPTSFSASVDENRHVHLEWTDNASSESEYVVYRSDLPISANYSPIATLASDSENYSDLELASVFYAYVRYYVVAKNSFGESGAEKRIPIRSVRFSALPGEPFGYSSMIDVIEDLPSSIVLRGREHQPQGSNFAYDVINQPINGALFGSPPNLIYLPDPNFHGQDSFQYTVSSPSGTSDPATITLNISAINDPPEASDQFFEVTENAILDGVLEATDVDSGDLSFAVFAIPGNGLASVEANGSFEYFPDEGFVGNDMFRVSVSDTEGGSTVFVVSVTVLPDSSGNSEPDVSLTSPIAGDLFATGEDVIVSASASDSDGEVVSVRFFEEGILIGEVFEAPYSMTYKPYFSGNRSIAAMAIDDSLGFSISDEVLIGVETDLPLLHSFEESEGFVAGSVDGQKGWNSELGMTFITYEKASDGLRSLMVADDPEREKTSLKYFPNGETPYFLDVRVIPPAGDDLVEGTFLEMAGLLASLTYSEGEAFLRMGVKEQDGAIDWNQYKLRVLPNFVYLEGSGLPRAVAPNWLRVTVRHDPIRNVLDLFVDGVLALPSLPVNGSQERPTEIILKGNSSVSAFADNLSIENRNPLFEDEDLDGISDAYEIENGLDPLVDDRNGDGDSDGLSNIEEFWLGLPSTTGDSDGDGLADVWEIETYGDLSMDAQTDSDFDGIVDQEEAAIGTLIFDSDSDNDGLSDALEIAEGSDPLANRFETEPPVVSIMNLADLDGLPLSRKLLKVRCSDLERRGAEGFAVSIRIVSGDVMISLADDPDTLLEEVIVETNPAGLLKETVFLTHGSVAGDRSVVEVKVGDVERLFEITTLAERLPAPVSGVTYQTNDDGSITVSWQDNSDNEDGFVIRFSRSDGTEETITVGPGQTSVTIPASE